MALNMSLLKVLKWIIAFILAGIISLGTAAFIMHFDKNADYSKTEGINFYLMSVLVPAAGFFFFIFLASRFVPFKKRNAALIGISISLIFTFLGAYQHYLDDGSLAVKYFIRYILFIVAIMSGFLFSKYTFLNTRWTS